ncbi:MAG TPA: MBL fold metallo-hydrolase [Anaerolineaceae bacterium]
MKIYFNGAAHDVTGSQYVLYVDGRSLMIDCGLYQGPDAYERNVEFHFDPHRLDALILTHAHIDHSGNLPNLVKSGFDGPIYTTPATADLADIMLRDSGNIQEDDASFLSKKFSQPYEPLYTAADAARVKRQFRPQEYKQTFQPIPGVTARLYDAGHILGSASVCLDVQEDGREPYRIWFSGDIGRLNLPLLKDPVLPQNANYLVMECTYGDQAHPEPDEAYTLLRDLIRRTIERGGKVIIPAFAVGRTQELIYNLNRMISANEIPAVPVYVDSPLAVNATQVFQEHPELFDKETQDFIREGRHPALNFKGLTYVESVAESKSINYIDRPAIIISASGMLQSGRILHHLRHNIGDPRNTILIVGWQAPDTLGRDLVNGVKEVTIYGDRYDVQAEVIQINGFSAHAGQDMLLQYALASKKDLRKVMLVHGEPDVAEKFAKLLKDAGIPEVIYPALREAVEIP